MRVSISICLVLLGAIGLTAGCMSNPAAYDTGGNPGGAAACVGNPSLINSFNTDQSWERIVEAINDFYFEIEREDRLAGTIETKYKAGASILEPWHADSVGRENRLESTFQSIRRRIVVSVQPSPPNALQVEVLVFKELEDLPGLAANSPGGSTFQESTPLQRDMLGVIGQSTPSIWIPQGRDTALEQKMMAHILTVVGQ
jgi:hypothetical protein